MIESASTKTFIILPTQLYSWPKLFWKQWKQILVIEDVHYINKSMHPLKLWMHRASMLEYFESIPHKSKKYINYHNTIDIDLTKCVMCHPTDKSVVQKYKKVSFIDSPGFILKLSELESMDTSIQNNFYKKMRMRMDLLMNGNKPIGNKWSFDTSNREKYPKTFVETNPFELVFNNQYIQKSKSIADLSLIKTGPLEMIWPTNRKGALKILKNFVNHKLKKFGPYQDAIRKDVLVGYHSCISVPLNIGLITPLDVIKEVLKYSAPIESIEGFIRQVIGWREYIRMKYVLYGLPKWNYLKNMNNKLDKSWYDGTTGIETLDWSINRVIKYGYVPHIERLMLLLNYATLLKIRYDDVHAWFVRMFCDGYDWVMLNVSMGVNSLAKFNKNDKSNFMTRAYLTNGTYLKNMGLQISKEDMKHLDEIYKKFIKDNQSLAKHDYRLASVIKRMNS